MQKIKFRGKDRHSNRWYIGSLVADGDRRWIYVDHPELGVFEQIEVEPKSIGQYIGLQDVFGKEYCSGDIVKVNRLSFKSSIPLPEILVIRYHAGMFQLFRGDECLMGMHLLYIEDGEIIGNIYENPQLIDA